MIRRASAKRISIIGILYLLLMAFSMPSHAFFSTGADGAFYPLGDTILDLPESGIFNFTSITVDPGIKVTFNTNGFNKPVFFLATESVNIRGILDVSAVGRPGGPGGRDAMGTIELPGGGFGDLLNGPPKDGSLAFQGIRLSIGGFGDPQNGPTNDDPLAFRGGAGGTTGGGGGAIWISTMALGSDIIVGGSILANGAPMGGSGGSIHLETPFAPGSLILLESTSILSARGYYGGEGGHIFLASNQVTVNGILDASVSPVPIPGAVWLLGSGLIGLVGFRRKFGNL